MKKIYLSLMGLLVYALAFSQNPQGKVIDASTKNPLSGAKININGTKITTTDDNGTFYFNCQQNLKLTVSFIGYETTAITIKDCNDNLVIALASSTSALDEVQLTGIKTDRQLLEKPQAIVQLDSAELNRGTGLFLDDVINANVPGVIMEKRAVSSGQQFNIRGYGNGVGFRGASNNFDGQGYKVYLNNIPITDAEGITQMDDIDFGSIGNVNVIKGPAGSLYGLAIAGVVNLQTIRPEAGKTSISQSVLGGRYGLARFTTQFQTATEKTSLLLNYGHQISDGFMDHSASTKDFMNFVLDYSPSERQYISTYFGFSNSYDQRGGELSIDQYEAKDYSGNERYIKNDAHSEVISFRAGLTHRYVFTNWLKNTTSIYGTGVKNNASSAGGWTSKDPLNYGVRSAFDLAFNLSSGFTLSSTTGFEYQEQRAELLGYSMIENPDDPNGYNIIGAMKSNQSADSKTYSLFTEWILNMPSDFSVTAGIGMSALNIDLQNNLYDASSSKPRFVSADYDNLVSPHIALNKVFDNNISIYASYSKGYKAPVSGNIVLSTTGALNTGLNPEVGDQFEIGSKGNLFSNKLHYQVALFNTVFKDKMTSVAVPLDENTTAYTYIANGGKQKNKGVEVLAKYNAYESETGFFKGINPYANLTYSDFEYEDFQYQSLNADGEAVTVDYSGMSVAGVAPWVVNAGIDFNTNPGLYGNLNYSYRDAMPFTSDGINNTNAYSLLNAKLGFRTSLNKFDFDIYAGADNITGTQYYYMVFVNQLPDAYLPAPYKINYYGGIMIKYNI
ncbi:MAG: TonB-dependent receptor [Leeuwenhoekiella sp.]